MTAAHFQPFAVEQYLSETEHGVSYNFSESGVHPMSYAELFELAEVDTATLFATLVDYPQVNGNTLLREPTASFWGDYERVIAINSMSKAYGLPGLRLGWLLAPAALIPALWRRHEYAAITATMMSMQLAAQALKLSARGLITARARGFIRRGFDTLALGLQEHPGVFSVVPPEASAMSFVKFDLPVSSDEFAARLLAEEDMLVIPGSRFGVEAHFRFSSALPDAHLRAGLQRLNALTGRILAAW